MKLNKSDKEKESLCENGALDLRKSGQAILKWLKITAENIFRQDRRIHIHQFVEAEFRRPGQ
ncbi:MAG: hypothetical protein NTZ01_07430 [Verrucomicrobia bacterium]|nr:hypothetical protein [Verrucomicrobiota bacterium]